VNPVTNDSVIVVVVAAMVRLAWWTVARCAEIVQDFVHGLALAALARVAGPGATVIERRADGTVLAVAIAEKERNELA
jgi:hypothetical protein